MAQQDLGNLIAELRKKANMTQQELADRLNISNKAVSKWERGGSSPDIETIPKLAEIFGITSEELLNAKLKEGGVQIVMYEYEFANVTLEKHGIIRKAKSTQHQEIINTYAKKGFRYAGFIPTQIDETGIMLGMDLILEKPV